MNDSRAVHISYIKCLPGNSDCSVIVCRRDHSLSLSDHIHYLTMSLFT